MDKVYVSDAGLAALKARLEKAQRELTAITQEKAIAYTQSGDTWHDNPTFNKLEQDEARKAADVSELSQLVANAEVYVFQERNTKRVQLGSIVRFHRYYEITGSEEEEVWEIVGYGETNAPKQQVAYNAPLASALIGLVKGGTTEAQTPQGLAEYEVLELYKSWDDVPEEFRPK